MIKWARIVAKSISCSRPEVLNWCSFKTHHQPTITFSSKPTFKKKKKNALYSQDKHYCFTCNLRDTVVMTAGY